jgi:hypothetical protein
MAPLYYLNFRLSEVASVHIASDNRDCTVILVVKFFIALNIKWLIQFRLAILIGGGGFILVYPLFCLV